MTTQQSQAELAWLDNPLSGIRPFSPKDDLVRPGKTRSPRAAMEAAQRAVAAGESGGVYHVFRPTVGATAPQEGEDQ